MDIKYTSKKRSEGNVYCIYYMDEFDFNNLKFGEAHFIDGKKSSRYDTVCLNDDTYKCFDHNGFISLEAFGIYSHRLYYDGYTLQLSQELFYIETFTLPHSYSYVFHNETGPALIECINGKMIKSYYLHDREFSEKDWKKQIATKLYW